MLALCLFDLDDTLILTEDLEEIRRRGKNHDSPAYRNILIQHLEQNDNRIRYTQNHLRSIQDIFPNIRFGVFTRSPKSYAATVLEWAYPGFKWDIIVAYEDVRNTKPHGDGIDLAMEELFVEYIDQVVLIGDGDVDIRAAYNAGVLAILDKGAWPFKWLTSHWNSISLVPDLIVNSPNKLIESLNNLDNHLPILESGLQSDGETYSNRFDNFNYFIPRSIGGDNKPYTIHYLGRHFSAHDCLKYRLQWHKLTESIHNHKDSDIFPDEWIHSILEFIDHHYPFLTFTGSLTITCIPPRPGRAHRLKYLLDQIQTEANKGALSGKIHVNPNLLAYRDGVRSNSRDHLSRDQRFENIRDHLYVNQPGTIAPHSQILVIDDVVTSGSTFIYSKLYLERSAACTVTCLAIAKNISKII